MLSLQHEFILRSSDESEFIGVALLCFIDYIHTCHFR